MLIVVAEADGDRRLKSGFRPVGFRQLNAPRIRSDPAARGEFQGLVRTRLRGEFAG